MVLEATEIGLGRATYPHTLGVLCIGRILMPIPLLCVYRVSHRTGTSIIFHQARDTNFWNHDIVGNDDKVKRENGAYIDTLRKKRKGFSQRISCRTHQRRRHDRRLIV
ncbi:hypothetical protein HZH66_013132 [Vespula vulgaris]|uniref:Uncharacterized protein n=1 Tax=Vespula vulgaris TaxID=7454 RepID=A0A834MSB3_VESVU|nr:hypothetical protein HZH66_013132 [Vespula vulgaris]